MLSLFNRKSHTFPNASQLESRAPLLAFADTNYAPSSTPDSSTSDCSWGEFLKPLRKNIAIRPKSFPMASCRRGQWSPLQLSTSSLLDYESTLKKITLKTEKTKRRLASNNTIELSEEQKLRYMRLMTPEMETSQPHLPIAVTLETEPAPLAKEKKPKRKRSGKFKFVRNIISKFSSKSDGEEDAMPCKFKTTYSSGSLTSLGSVAMSDRGNSTPTGSFSDIPSPSKRGFFRMFKSTENGYDSESQKTESPRDSLAYEQMETLGDVSNIDDVSKERKEGPLRTTLKRLTSIRKSKRPRSCSLENDQPDAKKVNAALDDFNSSLNDLCWEFDESLSDIKCASEGPRPAGENSKHATVDSPPDLEVRLYLNEVDVGMGLNLTLIENRNTPASFVATEIVADSPAGRCKDLHEGVEIVRINGTDLCGLTYAQAKSILLPKRGLMKLTVRPCGQSDQVRSRLSKPFAPSLLPLIAGKGTSNSPRHLSHTVNPEERPNFDLPSARKRVSFSDDSHQVSDHVVPSQNGSPVKRNDQNGGSPVDMKTGVPNGIPVRETVRGCMERFYFKKQIEYSQLPKVDGDLLYVGASFSKSKEALQIGISVVGGIDKGMPIYVKRIDPQSQAEEDGQLRPGDQLLYLNGLSFKGKTVEEATTMFKNIRQGPVRVTAVRKVSQKVKVM